MASSTDAAAGAAEGLVAYCRAGFEPELAAELGERAALADMHGHARTERNSGFVEFLGVDGVAATRALPFHDLVFARQKLLRFARLKGIDTKDRVSPVLDAAAGHGRFGELIVEHPDSDAARPLAGLARAFGNALRPALRKRGLLTEKEDARLPRLHVCFLTGDELLLGSSDPRDASAWPMGVPRLRQSAEAPSRSALKLEEAFLTLLTPAEREKLLKPGMRAADLGAAPGGWSWVLAKQHMRVLSVDNGPMAESALDTGLIEHVRADGFTWKPPKPQDWMVCDMVESPRRVASRMAQWFALRWCQHAVFNLKLPMKKRWDETRDCLALFQEQAGKPLVVRAKQLYHDREEVTVFATDPAARERQL